MITVSGSAFSQGRGHLLPHVNQAPAGSVSESIASRLRGQQALCERPTHPPYTCFFCANLHSESGTPPPPSPTTPTPHLSATSAAVPATLSTLTIPCQLLKPSHQRERPKPQQCQIPPHPPSSPSPWLLLQVKPSYLTCCFSQGQTLSFKTLSCAFPSCPTPSPGQLQQTLQIPWSHTGLVMPSWTLCSLIAPGTGPPASPDPC